MRGFLRKDIGLLVQNRSIPLVLVVMIVFMAAVRKAGFVIPYFAMLGCLLAIGTISYDDAEHGMGFLMTLPASRKTYVLEKYVFGYGTALLFIVVGSAAELIAGGSGREETELLFISALILTGVMMTLFLPVQLKFGAENGRIIMCVIFVGIFAGTYLIRRICGNFDINMERMADSVAGLGFPVLLLLTLAAVAAASFLSCLISIHIMKRKEF